MEKQTSTTRKNKRKPQGAPSLNLGTKKDDECYTRMQDILNELSYWAALGKFKDKNIICPCDWDIVDGEEIYSITITYKENCIDVEGNNVYKAVKSVCYDLWSDDTAPVVTKINLKEEEIEDFLRDKLTCNFLRTFTQFARAWGIKSITASGYNPANGKGVPFQDVDYSKYDICVTNPPFSLYSEFMKKIVGKIDFIILAPFMKRSNPCYGLYLMTKQAYLGTSSINEKGYIVITFDNPTIKNKFNEKPIASDWLTSFSEADEERKAKQRWKTGVKYDLYKDDYIEYPKITMKDGTHPIKVPSDAFPEDYTGWMCAPVNVITRLDDSYEWYGTHYTGYFNKQHPELNPLAHNFSDYMLELPGVDKTPFCQILFRKKPTNE